MSRTPEPPAAPAPAPPAKRPGPIKRARLWLKDNHGKLFWVHSLYALGLGAFVATFAAKGFGHARWLVLMLVGAWAMILVIFRFFGAGKERQFDTTGHRVTYLVMTYVLKNLYQGMLFFLLPFYYKTAVMDGPTVWFFGVLAAVAFLSTMDVIFDNVLMKWRPVASFFYMLVLFAVINLSIPALVPEVAAVYVTLWAGGLATFAFFMMHVPLKLLREDPRWVAALVAVVSLGVGAAYVGRRAIPPVPMYISSGAVGPEVLPDGRLALKVTELHRSKLNEMYAVTDVVVPGGEGDQLIHVWRQVDSELTWPNDQTDCPAATADGPKPGTIRLCSKLTTAELPEDVTGRWSVDVETTDGQLVGRARFTVTE